MRATRAALPARRRRLRATSDSPAETAPYPGEPYGPASRQILALRTRARLPCTVAAEDAGIDPWRLRAIEEGRDRPSLAELVRLTAVLCHYADVDEDDTLVALATAAGYLIDGQVAAVPEVVTGAPPDRRRPGRR